MNFGFTYFSEVALLGWPLPYSMISSIEEVKCLKIFNMVWTEVWFPTLVSAFTSTTFHISGCRGRDSPGSTANA